MNSFSGTLQLDTHLEDLIAAIAFIHIQIEDFSRGSRPGSCRSGSVHSGLVSDCTAPYYCLRLFRECYGQNQSQIDVFNPKNTVFKLELLQNQLEILCSIDSAYRLTLRGIERRQSPHLACFERAPIVYGGLRHETKHGLVQTGR